SSVPPSISLVSLRARTSSRSRPRACQRLSSGTSRVVPGAMAMTLHIGGKWPNQRRRRRVAEAVVRGGICPGRRHCAPHPDRLGFRRRSDSTFPASRAAPAAADRVFKGATAPHGFPQATVHADEPSPPYL